MANHRRCSTGHMHNEMRKPIGLGQLRSHTCGVLERVVAGETISVVRRGLPAGRIMPISGRSDEPKVRARTCSLDELRTRAGRLFDKVAAGEAIEVVWRGQLVARIAPAVDSPEALRVSPVLSNGAPCWIENLRPVGS
jgi:prevent-host-death family protein